MLGHFQGHRVDTQFGEKWLITPESVDRHIAYIKEVTPPTGRDLSRHDVTSRDSKPIEIPPRQNAEGFEEEPRQPPTSSDPSRPVATTQNEKSQLVALLERENSFLRDQVGVKDKQIAELSELYRGTHILTQGLQRLLAPLIGASDPTKRAPQAPTENGNSRDRESL